MSSTKSPIQCLPLTLQELEETNQALMYSEAGFIHQRGACRHPYHRVGVAIHGGNGNQVSRHQIYVRNLSVTGAAVLYMVASAEESTLKLILIGSDSLPYETECKVVRCEHVGNGLFDIGLRFKEEITEEDMAVLMGAL